MAESQQEVWKAISCELQGEKTTVYVFNTTVSEHDDGPTIEKNSAMKEALGMAKQSMQSISGLECCLDDILEPGIPEELLSAVNCQNSNVS